MLERARLLDALPHLLNERREAAVEGHLDRDGSPAALGGLDQAVHVARRSTRRLLEQERQASIENLRGDGDGPLDRHHHHDRIRPLGLEHRREVAVGAGMPELAAERLSTPEVDVTARRQDDIVLLGRAAPL